MAMPHVPATVLGGAGTYICQKPSDGIWPMDYRGKIFRFRIRYNRAIQKHLESLKEKAYHGKKVGGQYQL